MPDLSLVAVALGVYSLLMTLAVWKLDRLHTKALAMITDLQRETRELRNELALARWAKLPLSFAEQQSREGGNADV